MAGLLLDFLSQSLRVFSIFHRLAAQSSTALLLQVLQTNRTVLFNNHLS